MTLKLSCFKAYDIRGRYPEDIDENLAFALGRAISQILEPNSVVVGRDARLSGSTLENSLIKGMSNMGTTVFRLGLCGTEEIYHACGDNLYDTGIMITGSHNPKNENGFKIVKSSSQPVSNAELQRIAEYVHNFLSDRKESAACTHQCQSYEKNHRDAYIKKLIRLAGLDKAVIQECKKLKIVADAGNGCAGLILSQLKRFLPFDFIEENYTPDGNFPNGVPNPLLPERRAYTSRRVVESGADLGVAFDGDFDRCFFYDRKGNFLDSYYMVGLLAAEMLALHPGEKIIHDPRVYWNTREVVLNAGGIPVMAKTGHAFIKEAMRRENALYGGEMSGHHYFRDFSFCDSGMLTMLLVLKNLVGSSQDLEEIIEKMRLRWPNSGEINFRVEDPDFIISQVWDTYLNNSVFQDKIDGINMEFKDWRFNLRKSNTENLLRLNVESRGDPDLLQEKTAELQAFCQKLI